MISKKTRLMALCEELATPVTHSGEFQLKGGFGGGNISARVYDLNGGCINQGCYNGPCPNFQCINIECTNVGCEESTPAPDPTPDPTDEPTKKDDNIVLCGFLL